MQTAGIGIRGAVAAIIMAVISLLPACTPKTADSMAGELAPIINLETLARVTARTPKEGRTLINFWGTWCTPCLAEHPYLLEMADKGLNIVGVAYRDNPQRVKDYLARAGDPFSTVYLDPNGEAMDAFQTRGVPESFLIDADGKILVRISGALVPETLNPDVRALLGL